MWFFIARPTSNRVAASAWPPPAASAASSASPSASRVDARLAVQGRLKRPDVLQRFDPSRHAMLLAPFSAPPGQPSVGSRPRRNKPPPVDRFIARRACITMPAMCGFAGEFLLGPGRADLDLAREWPRAWSTAGPTKTAPFLSADGRCAIGFQRLAIIDPPGSHQPMTSDDGLLTVAFNGEIYNFRQLRQELSRRRRPFPHRRRHRGPAAPLPPPRHRDARATWTACSPSSSTTPGLPNCSWPAIASAKSPSGTPRCADRIVFASEAKATLAHPQVGTRPTLTAITHYLTIGYVPCTRLGLDRALAKLPPAASCVATDRIGSRPSATGSRSRSTYPRTGGELRELVRTAVSAPPSPAG